jgi:hypothetical protein
VFPYENLVKNLNLEIEKWKINIFNNDDLASDRLSIIKDIKENTNIKIDEVEYEIDDNSIIYRIITKDGKLYELKLDSSSTLKLIKSNQNPFNEEEIGLYVNSLNKLIFYDGQNEYPLNNDTTTLLILILR